MEKPTILHILQLTQPHLVFCEIKVYDLIVEVLAELKMDANIFTFNGNKRNSLPVDVLFAETGIETSFM